MCCYDTEENERSDYTDQTLISLRDTVDFTKHKLVVIDNGSCELTKRLLKRYQFITDNFTIITLPENVGTARAINLGLQLRQPGENCIKLDNDVVFSRGGWVDELEEAIAREPGIGIAALKRKDLMQSPTTDNLTFRSELIMLPHEAGQSWIVVEKSRDIMGTCTMFSSALLDKIGFMHQPGKYGFDDQIMALRSLLAGFWNCFLPNIVIDHIDDGTNEYSEVKRNLAAQAWYDYQKMHEDYVNGALPLYYDGGFDK